MRRALRGHRRTRRKIHLMIHRSALVYDIYSRLRYSTIIRSQWDKQPSRQHEETSNQGQLLDLLFDFFLPFPSLSTTSSVQVTLLALRGPPRSLSTG